MIPTHEFSDKALKSIVVNELVSLMEYDASEPHRHDYFELFIFLKGGGKHIIDFEEFVIHDYSIHIVAPGRVHEVRRSLDSHGFVLLFETDVLASHHLIMDFLFDHICYTVQEYPPVYRFDGIMQEQMAGIARSIWNDSTAANPLSHEFVLHNLALLCITCMRHEQRVRPVVSQGSVIYLQFRRMLHEQFRALKKVREYAALLNISEKQLNEIVKSQTGNPASAVIYKQIILEAKRLLNTGISAKQAAYELQFDDPAHFSKFFKSQTELSPSEFQKVQS